ncbi:MAG: hypothetical protein VX768_16220 [Planctomycetota bacterium]|nr:hypothetical protein [Planctomycetota bacterium]
MITEMQKKMGGWIVEAVAPALIMMMTGSLAFFLVEVFYYGAHVGRVKWVLGLFVFASVLISRISIEEGYEKATFYGLFLGLATLVVLSLLTEVQLLLSVIFIGTIWWFNNKLTWDCSVIDNTKDSTDRGLLARIGMDNETHVATSPEDADNQNSNAGFENEDLTLGTSTEEDSKAEAWTQRFFSKKKLPNTPGVWVLILSLAAFPIFGFGQGFLADELRRQNAFFDFCLYLIGGLGLLVTTAMMGLQRYLQRRQATMPNSVALSWVACGVAMIGVILFFAWVLPRPYSEYAIAENPFKFTHQSQWGSSRNPVGSEGKDDGQGGNRDDSSQNKTGNGKSGQKGGNRPGSKNSGGASRGKSKSGGKSSSSQDRSGSKSGAKSPGKGQTNKNSSGSSQQQKNGKQSGSKSSKNARSNSNNQSGKSPRNDNTSRDKNSSQGGRSSDQEKNPEGDSSRQKQGPGSERGKPENSGKSGNPSDSPDRQQPERRNEPGTSEKQRQRSQPGQSGRSQNREQSPRNSNSSSSNSSSNFKVPSFPRMMGLVQILFWAIIILALIIFAIRYRQQLLASLLKFIEDLRNFWANLFGTRKNKRPTSDSAAGENQPLAEKKKPFAAYPNPFQTGASAKMTSAELVRYSYEALEAWACERGLPQEEDRTPHEFAIQLAQLDQGIASRAKNLADVYCMLAFARTHAELPAANGELAQLWESFAGAGNLQKSSPLQPA